MISVALCTYNGENFIEEQLDSILNQTLPVDELVICDDGSSDNTLEILKKYKDKDNRIKIYTNKKNLGSIKNFEKAILLTSGNIIFLSDQDDIWKDDKVEIMYNFFQKNQSCSMLFTNGILIDEYNNSLGSTLWEKWEFDDLIKLKWKINKNAFLDLIRNKNKVTGATLAFKGDLKNEFIPINTPLGYWHDTWIAMHAAYSNSLFFLDECTIKYRSHKNQQIGLNTKTMNVDKFKITFRKFKRIIKKKFPEYAKDIDLIPEEKKMYLRIIHKIKRILNIKYKL